MSDGLEVAVAFDPHLPARVDEDLVDRLVAQQRIELAEPVEPGDGGAYELFGGVGTSERRDAAHVGADD